MGPYKQLVFLPPSLSLLFPGGVKRDDLTSPLLLRLSSEEENDDNGIIRSISHRAKKI